jgi:hypothetical protein
MLLAPSSLGAVCPRLDIQGAGSWKRIAKGGKSEMMPPRRITMPREIAEADSHATVKDQVVELYDDFEHEVVREVHSPHDSSQSDALVRKHINGLVIAFFILIALSLLATITALAIYTRH